MWQRRSRRGIGFLTGTVYTAHDSAHKRISELLDRGEALPFELDGAVIY